MIALNDRDEADSSREEIPRRVNKMYRVRDARKTTVEAEFEVSSLGIYAS